MSFKDHFSRQATDYAQFRPQYPRALFEFVATNSPNDELGLDVATGNEQAALALADFFQKVIACDASADQIAQAQPGARVDYRVATAEATGLPENSCAAVTVAQALHWLGLDGFYGEARRVLQPGGVLAVWAYNYLRISPGIDMIVRRFHNEIVGPFCPPERKIVGRGYLALPFPFSEIEAPPFQIETRWSREHLLGYLRIWSATQRFLTEKGSDPVDLVEQEIEQTWGEEGEKMAIWPLTPRIGRR